MATVHLLVEIELTGDDFASPNELDLRSRLTDTIEARGIGEVGGFGSGMGCMDLSVIVSDEERGRKQVAAVIRQMAPEAKFRIRALPDES